MPRPATIAICPLRQQSMPGALSCASAESAGAVISWDDSAASCVEGEAWCACPDRAAGAGVCDACPAILSSAVAAAAGTPRRQSVIHAESAAGDPDSANTVATLVSRLAHDATFRVYLHLLLAEATCGVSLPHHSVCRLSRSALAMTDTELNVIAALAMIGLSSRPNAGYSTPAAMGTPSTL